MKYFGILSCRESFDMNLNMARQKSVVPMVKRSHITQPPVADEVDDRHPPTPSYTETDLANSLRAARPRLNIPIPSPIDTSGSSSGASFLSPNAESTFSTHFPRRSSISSSIMSPRSTIGTSPSLGPQASPIPQRHRRPLEPIEYVFQNASYDSMTLAPSSATPAEDAVQYHISVRVNCFSPSFWITTIMRMGPDSGEYVGEFEMGYSNAKPSTLCIHGREYKLKGVFKVNFGDYTWTPTPGRGLLWDKVFRRHSTPVFTCSTLDRTVAYAKFFPVTDVREPGQGPTLTRLIIYPEGYEFFDDILMSVLVIERVRTGGTLS